MAHKNLSSRGINPCGTGKSLIAILILHVFAACGFPQDPQSFPLKVMTYNIWNGFEWGKDSVRREQCITWIKSQEPDVLALQEMCGYTEEKLKEDAKKWGHPYVQLLKTEGYPTALTSKSPIRLKEKIVEPFWHGLLHCESYGIDFYIVHLSPADCNIRLKEARLISERIKKNNKDGGDRPVITVKTYNTNEYASEVSINGPSKVIYSPSKPLSCGARVWIEADYDDIELI